MKTFIYFFVLIFCLFVFPLASYGQLDADIDPTGNTNNYQFYLDAVITPCADVDGNVPGAPINMALGENGFSKYSFTKENVLTNGNIIIKFWIFEGSTNANMKKKYNYNYNAAGQITGTKYFIVKAKDFQEKCQKRYKVSPFNGGTSVTGGVVLLPIKIRPKTPNSITGKNGGFDFSKDVSLGLSIGLKQRISRNKPFFLNLLFCSGIGSVGLDSFNTEGLIKSSSDVPAWTLATGFVLDYKVIQFGAFVGWDNLSSKNRNNWIYQGAPWFSLGIGYSLFSVSTQSANKAGSQ